MLETQHLPRLLKPLALLAAALAFSTNASATLINFDNVADGTLINNAYSSLGVTFDNPLGVSTDNVDSPNIYARSFSHNASPSNVVSVFSTGVPAFDARYGAVEAVFSTGQKLVSIDAAILRLPEGLTTPINDPILEVFDLSNNLIATVHWDFGLIPQPDVGGITAFQTLSYTSTTDNIGKVRLLSTQPGGSPSNFGLFDNLSFGQGTSNVPEPGTTALVALGLLGLGLNRSSRRRAG